jgi:hypothetical protein
MDGLKRRTLRRRIGWGVRRREGGPEQDKHKAATCPNRARLVGIARPPRHRSRRPHTQTRARAAPLSQKPQSSSDLVAVPPLSVDATGSAGAGEEGSAGASAGVGA